MLILLATQCSLQFDQHKKDQVHCLHLLRFNQNLEEKSNISAKIEAVNYLHAVLLLTAEQRRRLIRL